jgi:glycosyltransferase involved in cell wall biosynthesis
MDAPVVSFVIPVLNGERYVSRCLRSIRDLALHGNRIEVVVIDNGSTDRTHDIVRGEGFAFQVARGPRVGGLRNIGLQSARGTYVAFVDADVELDRDWLIGALAAFADTDVVAAGCFPAVPTNATWVQRAWDLHQRRRWPEARPSTARWLSSMNLIVRRADLLAIEGFNEALETAEDVDLSYRLASRGRLLWNPAMRAVHWGEAPDLRVFWRKEVWRGKGNLRGVRSHGLRWDELPSIGYPLYTGVAGAASLVAAAVDAWGGQVRWLPMTAGVLLMPAFLLALQTGYRSASFRAVPQLFLLYAIYGWARAYALIRA